MKHTPGPWFEGTGWIGHGNVKEGRVICRIDNYPYGNSEANARLIAAAPELLEALETARSFIACGELEGHTDNCIFHKVDAAIQKARGAA